MSQTETVTEAFQDLMTEVSNMKRDVMGPANLVSQAVDRLVEQCRAAEEIIEGKEQTLAKLKEETKEWETKRDEMWESYLKRKVNIAHDLDGLIRERQAIRDSVK